MNCVEFKCYFNGLAEIKAAGRYLSFSAFQLYYALQLMSKATISRSKIAKLLNVGEGTARTILSRLVDAGLVKISKSGCKLTGEGLRVCREFDKFFPQRGKFFWTELTPFDYNYGFVIREGADKVGSGIEQRDKAIVVGATRALVAVFRNGRLRINAVSDDIEQAFPIAAQKILQDLKPQENDAIVIASGETPIKAMHGAFAASWSLMDAQAIRQ
ncbi:MAG: DUF4443 domain-containing protein [Candidatus Bathyarchaeia archaeon]